MHFNSPQGTTIEKVFALRAITVCQKLNIRIGSGNFENRKFHFFFFFRF